MGKWYVLSGLSLLVATVFGMFGQQLTILVHEAAPVVPALVYLIIFTATSLFLYFMMPVAVFRMRKNTKGFEKLFIGLLALTFMIGLPVILWEAYVLSGWLDATFS